MHRPVILVCAGLDDDVDHAAGGVPVLGGIDRRQDLELFDHVDN
jgi:hypothetical protein